MIVSYLIFLAVASLTQGLKRDGFWVKYGPSDDKINQEYFFKIPRTENDASLEGWTPTARAPESEHPRLRLYCPPDSERIVCSLYDTFGFIAGLQIALPMNGFKSPIKVEELLKQWDVPAVGPKPAKSYWIATQYFVEDDSVARKSTAETLQDSAVWLSDWHGQLRRISVIESALKSTPFKKQNCIPNMGTHYYYNFTRGMDCSKPVPWFLLTSGEELIGSGFLLVGSINTPNKWFESKLPSTSFKYVAPDVPECMLDQVEKYGSLNMHIYYVDEPWKIRCNA